MPYHACIDGQRRHPPALSRRDPTRLRYRLRKGSAHHLDVNDRADLLVRIHARDAEHVSRSCCSGWFNWLLRSPGYYEIRNVQHAASEASIGRLDRGILRIHEAGAITRVTRDHVIAAMEALEAA